MFELAVMVVDFIAASVTDMVLCAAGNMCSN